jgi:hypothetical protein
VAQHGTFQIEAMPFQIAMHLFNGLITNDKFCMVRTGQLYLSHWRRPLRLRTPEPEQEVFSPSEKSDRGGSHETPVEDPSGGSGVSKRTRPLGSSLSPVDGDSPFLSRGSAADEPGGEPCE